MHQLNAELKQHMRTLRISEAAGILDNLLMEAEKKGFTYQEFLGKLLKHEVRRRDEKSTERRLKQAAFPEHRSLDEFDIGKQKSLSQKQLKQLRELQWLEQAYNIILLGLPGVGKTFIATGLGLDAVYSGYKVSFITMGDLVHVLKTQEITRSSKTKLKRIIDSDLIIIDDLMFLAMDRHKGNLFFQLINKLYGQSSVIVTSNKGPEDWTELLGDQAIATAILDRLIHRCEIISFNDDSYRMTHRETIFGRN